MNAVDVHRLSVFLTAARAGSFTGAAHELGIGQPAVSRAVAALEESLGVRLIERSTRTFRLTEPGLELERDAARGLESVEAALARASRAGDPAQIVVGMKPHGDAGLLAPAVALAGTAGVRSDVLMCDVSSIPGLVRDGSIDIGITAGAVDLDGLESDEVLREPRVLVVAASHPLAGAGVVSRDAVAGVPVVTWPDADERLAAYFAGHDSGARTVAGPAARNLVEALGLVELDRGAMFLPASVAERYGSARLAIVAVPWLSASEVRVSWREGERSRSVATFIRALHEVADERRSEELRPSA